jgi:hypothetical protein
MDKKTELYNKIMDLGKQVANLQADFMILCLKYQSKYGQREFQKLMTDFERSN